MNRSEQEREFLAAVARRTGLSEKQVADAIRELGRACDLDELERKARALMAARAAAPRDIAGEPMITQETANAEWAHGQANSPPVTLALIARIRELEAIERALRAFEAVHIEIDAEPDDLDPMSPRAVELGGRSIDAWKRVTAALEAVRS
jgi:hypothetical protein